MAKIPFSIDYRSQIESGKYKVETRDGHAARIICWDSPIDKDRPIIGVVYDDQIEQYKADGHYENGYETSDYDLFIVTPEPELSEFERAIAKYRPTTDSKETIQRIAAELLALAREQFIKDGYVIEKKAFHDAVEKVSPEVMKKVSDNVDMQIALRTEYEKGRADALKDLPRWRKWGNGACGNSDGHPIALVAGYGGIRFVSCLGTTGEKYIMLCDLKKLPGFKED